jgi:hypothetical protein
VVTQELVRFLCVSAEHIDRGRDPEGGVLTVEEGRWAFCPWGQVAGHEWVEVEAMDLTTARTARPANIPRALDSASHVGGRG